MADALYNAILGDVDSKKSTISSELQPISDEDLNHPLVRKALQYVNAYEGSPKANELFGHKEFNDLSKHPNVKIPFTNKGDVTTAAGSYQILAPTWEEQAKKQGLKDFSQDSQDRAAIGIMRDIGALDALKKGDYDKAKQLLGKAWASIPGSTIGKSTGQIPKLDSNKETILPSGDSLYNAILGNEIPKAPINQSSDIPVAIQSQPSKKEEMSPWAKKVLGVGEAAAALVANPVISTVGAAKGIIESLPQIASGKAPEIAAQIADKFEKEHGYSPTSEEGKRYLQSIGETFQGLVEKATGSSMPLPPIVPELQGITQGRAAASQIEKQFERAKVGAKPSAKVYEFPTQEERPTMAGVGAATAKASPYPELSGQETARGEFPQIKFEKMAGDVPANEQRIRAQIISEINPEGRPRSGLITGNENAIRNEYTAANSSERTPAGDILKAEIAKEQQALPNYAKRIIEETGADQLLPDNESRAYRIRNALDEKEGLAKNIEDVKRSIYQDAFNKVGNNPVAPTNIENLLTNKQFQAELKLKKLQDFTGGAKELLDLHKTEGFEGTAPNSIAGLEKLRQSLNASWSPENSFAIRRATKAIDEDIAAAGGSETLLKARALHKAEQDLFGSKGIKDLLTEEDANGIQTGIPNEKLMDKLNKMPNDQWRHIYDTLGKAANGEIVGIAVTPEVRQAARAAQAEMKGALARDIYEAGAAKAGEWNPNAANNKFNLHNSKIKHAFDPEEIRKLYTLNLGGYLMPAKSPYEGAGLQLQRVSKIASKLPVAGKIAGAATRIPFAETAGTWLGQKGEQALKGRSLKKQAKALEQELEENKKLGTKLSDLIGKK
jgi:muramidase (phage lysozyme)